MAVHFFVQDQDLKVIKSNWKTNEYFAAFVGEFELIDMEYAIDDIYTKHFRQWHNDYLHIALLVEDVPARYIANWLLELPIPDDLQLEYYSKKHKTTINTLLCG